jgi:SET domain-containing protein
MLSTFLLLAKFSSEVSFKSLSTNEKDGALVPTCGKLPSILTLLPANVTIIFSLIESETELIKITLVQ